MAPTEVSPLVRHPKYNYSDRHADALPKCDGGSLKQRTIAATFRLNQAEFLTVLCSFAN